MLIAACTPFAGSGDTRDGGDAEGGVAAFDAGAPEAAASSYAAAILKDQPIAYFRFEESTRGALYDEVTKTSSGTIVGDVELGAPGLIGEGKAVTFHGNDCIVLDDRLDFPGNAPFTIEVWARRMAAGEFNHLFTKQDRRSNKRGYALLSDRNGYFLERFVDTQEARSPQTGVPPSSEVWHLAASYDGINLKISVNGQPTTATKEDPRTGPNHDVPAIIGAADDSCMSGFQGTLDELAIYDKALTPAQIQAHFTAP